MQKKDSSPKTLPIRAQAAQAINQVIYHGKSLAEIFSNLRMVDTTPAEIALLKHCCFGGVRYFNRLEAAINTLLNHPLPKKHALLQCLLVVGLYQLEYLSLPPYVCVNETVAACSSLGKAWATKLTNQILRQWLRRKQTISPHLNQHLPFLYAHPNWLIQLLQHHWPSQWQDILEYNNIPAPLYLRVNRQLITTAAYLKLLDEHNINAAAIFENSTILELKHAVAANKLPGFDQGLCYIQDLSGQLVVGLLELQPGQHVLDSCAAPGSKTTHILETEPNLKTVTACDQSTSRLALLSQNLLRLQHMPEKVKIIHTNVSDVDKWWNGQLYDRILVDAPCSGSGVIRRHPDIKWLRKESDIATLASNQLKLLSQLWPTLAINGLLIYTTCSVLQTENDQVIESFLLQHPNANNLTLHFPIGNKTNFGWQILPQDHNCDGFYYAKLRKTA